MLEIPPENSPLTGVKVAIANGSQKQKVKSENEIKTPPTKPFHCGTSGILQ
jgi:hypothetical protein